MADTVACGPAMVAVAGTRGGMCSPQGHVPAQPSCSGGSVVASWTFFVLNVMAALPFCETRGSLDLLFSASRPPFLWLAVTGDSVTCSQIFRAQWEGLMVGGFLLSPLLTSCWKTH